MRLRLESLAKGGEAVGRADDGRVVFVDGGVPGDLVEVALDEDRARYARGHVAELIEPGPGRVAPPCALAERCGGCPWQIVDPSTQRSAKQEIVARALRGIEVAPILAAPQALGYRVRATMHARRGTVGFFARRSHEVVAVDHCPALVPALDLALQVARRALPLGEDAELRGTVAGEVVHLAVDGGHGQDDMAIDRAAAQLVGMAGIAGVVVERSGRPRATHGAASIDAGEHGRPLWVSAAGFRQANVAQNDRLRALVTELLEPDGARVLELFCGDGNFTRDLVGRAARILAIEEDAAAVARLRRSLPTVEALAVRAADGLRRRGGDGWDRVLLDPPRAGAKDAMDAIAGLRAARVVYVSCDPATLARDAGVLRDGGYAIVRATPIDLMPHTDHVEVVLLATLRL